MAQALPSFPDEISIGPAFYMPDIDGISDVRKYLEEKTDAQCNFAGCGKRPTAKKTTNEPPGGAPRIWEEGNPLNTPNVPTTNGLPLEDDLSNAIPCYICGFPIDGRRGAALDIQNTWGGQCEHVMAVAALATLCGLAGDNYEYIVNKFMEDCGINDPDYKAWRNRLVKQPGESTQKNEGGGTTGILYKWAHPGCNEIKGNNPYLRIDFSAIARRVEGWYETFKEGMSGTVGGAGEWESIYNEGVIKWNLACMCGANKGKTTPSNGKEKIPDGGKKSMYWRKRYELYIKGIENINVYDQVIKDTTNKLREIITASTLFYKAAATSKKNAAADLKRLQRELIKGDKALNDIQLRIKGELVKKSDGSDLYNPTEWENQRCETIKSEVLKPIVDNIVTKPPGKSKPLDTKTLLDKETLRKFICISQCILTRIFEDNLTDAVGKLQPDNFENWSYAPACQLASDIVTVAFTEINNSGNKNFKKIFDTYKDRLKDIPRKVKELTGEIKKTSVMSKLKTVKAAANEKKKAVKKAVVKTGARIKKAGARIKKALPKRKSTGTAASKKTKKRGGCRTCKKDRKRKTIKRKTIKRSRLYGGNKELIPYRMAIFTSKNVKMKSILRGRRFRIYREYLAPNHRITEFGKSRIMRWLSLLLSDLDIEDDLLNNYSFELKLMEDEPYPVICTINVLCEKIQTASPTEIEDNLLLELYNKGKIFKEGDDIYNLGMYKYLIALTLSDRIPSLIDELMYTFDLKFYAQLEMRGIDINKEMKGRAPVQEKGSEGSVRLFIKKPDSNEEPVIQYVKSNTASRAASKRTKKKGKNRKHKKKISGGDPPYKDPAYQGLIASQAVLNLNGTNFLSDYVTTSLLNDDETYRKEKKVGSEEKTQYDDEHLKEYEKSFFDIIKTPESTDDYQDDEAYTEISHAKNSGGFNNDPIFSLFGEGQDKIIEKGEKIREKWGEAELQLDERNTRIFYILGMIDYLSGIDIYSYDGNGEDPVEEYLYGLSGDGGLLRNKTHPIVHGYKEGGTEHESQYSADVNKRATDLLSGIVKAKLISLIIDKEKENAKHTSTQTPPGELARMMPHDLKKQARGLGVDEEKINEADDDCEKLLSYFGMSYGPNSDKDNEDDTIYETIKLSSNSDKITKMKEYIRKFVINVTMVNVMTYPYIRCYVNYDPVYKRYMWIYDPIMEDDNGYGRNFCRTTRRYQGIWSDKDIHTSMNPYTFAYE